MKMDLAEYKKKLRKEKIKAREALPEDDRIRFSEAISERILATPEYEEAENIFIYKWIRGEVRLDEFERRATADGKQLIYPLVISRTEMTAIHPGTGKGAWKEGYYGIEEPVLEEGTVIEPEAIDLVIAPCTSFDDSCRRLGMGGGFYVRYLAGCTVAIIIAAAVEVQHSEEIPADEYDFPVDAVATELRLIRSDRSKSRW